MMGSTEDLESRAGAKSYPVIGATQPTQSQYPAAESAEKLRAQGPPELHGWKKALDIAANVFPIGREIEAQTGLGSTGYQAKLGRAQRAATEESTLASAETTREKNAADTEEAQARAEALRHPPAKQGATPEETTLHDLMTGANGGPRVNPATGKPYNYLEALDAVNKTKQEGKPDQTDKVVRIVGSVPHEILIDKRTGADIKDLGQTKLPGEAPATKEAAQVERESRQAIRKASEQYRDTQKSVGQLSQAIDGASDGNGLLTSFVPTMEVLGINAANGVHRISPAEAQAAQLPGGWAERFNAWFDKASTGKVSPELKTEGKQLAQILAKTSYQKYKSVYEDEAGIVHGYGGQNFAQRVPMIPEEAGQEHDKQDVIYARDLQGKLHKAPAGTQLPEGWKQEKK